MPPQTVWLGQCLENISRSGEIRTAFVSYDNYAALQKHALWKLTESKIYGITLKISSTIDNDRIILIDAYRGRQGHYLRDLPTFSPPPPVRTIFDHLMDDDDAYA